MKRRSLSIAIACLISSTSLTISNQVNAATINLGTYFDLKFSRSPDSAKVGDTIFYNCQKVNPNATSHSECAFDFDGPLGPDPWESYFPGERQVSFNQPGIHSVFYGTLLCGITGCNPLSFPHGATERVIVAPSAGWSISAAGPSTGTTGQSYTFSAKSQSAKDCCEFQWAFGDGNEKGDSQTDGTSSVSHRFTRAGTYTVTVSLEDPFTHQDVKNGSSRVIAQKTITITEPAVAAPAAITSVKFNHPLTNGTPTTFPLSMVPSDNILYDHNFDRAGTSRTMSWSKPSGASTRIEYMVDFGNAGITGVQSDISWSLYKSLGSSTTSADISVLPGVMFTRYSNAPRFIPFKRSQSGSVEYVKIYYRLRSEQNSKASDWHYLQPIWLYQPN